MLNSALFVLAGVGYAIPFIVIFIFVYDRFSKNKTLLKKIHSIAAIKVMGISILFIYCLAAITVLIFLTRFTAEYFK
jgi:hypothetical protein